MADCLLSFVEHLNSLNKLVAPGSNSVNSEKLFGALINNELRARVGTEDIQRAASLVTDYYRAVELCRANQLAAAQAQLQRCDEHLQTLPSESTAFVLLSRAGAWSNYYYKAQQSSQAIEVLREGFHTSAALERQGYSVFLYWRIGQLFNITTVLFKEKNFEQAHHLLKNALKFAYSGQASDLLIDDWYAQPVDSVRLLQESCLDQLFGQVAQQNTRLMEHEQYGNSYYCHFFFNELLVAMEAETYNRVVIYNWMYAKVSYEEQGLRAFLDNTMDFITDPAITRDFDVFKVNLLAQVQWALQQQFPHDQQLTEQVKRFSDANFTDRLGNVIRLK